MPKNLTITYCLFIAFGWTSLVASAQQNDATGSSDVPEQARAASQTIPEASTIDLAEPLPFQHGHTPPIASSETTHLPFDAQPVCLPADPHHRGRFGTVKEWYARRKARKQARYWGYPEEFCEIPLGSRVQAHLCAQMRSGLMSQCVLYMYDFQDPGDDSAAQLKPRGLVQLQKIARILACDYFTVVIETSGDGKLDEARRQHVFNELASLGYPVTDEQIVSSRVSVDGLQGAEAFDIYANLLQQTQLRGRVPESGVQASTTAPQAVLISQPQGVGQR
jgi:hypothetical protein